MDLLGQTWYVSSIGEQVGLLGQTWYVFSIAEQVGLLGQNGMCPVLVNSGCVR